MKNFFTHAANRKIFLAISGLVFSACVFLHSAEAATYFNTTFNTTANPSFENFRQVSGLAKNQNLGQFNSVVATSTLYITGNFIGQIDPLHTCSSFANSNQILEYSDSSYTSLLSSYNTNSDLFLSDGTVVGPTFPAGYTGPFALSVLMPLHASSYYRIAWNCVDSGFYNTYSMSGSTSTPMLRISDNLQDAFFGLANYPSSNPFATTGFQIYLTYPSTSSTPPFLSWGTKFLINPAPTSSGGYFGVEVYYSRTTSTLVHMEFEDRYSTPVLAGFSERVLSFPLNTNAIATSTDQSYFARVILRDPTTAGILASSTLYQFTVLAGNTHPTVQGGTYGTLPPQDNHVFFTSTCVPPDNVLDVGGGIRYGLCAFANIFQESLNSFKTTVLTPTITSVWDLVRSIFPFNILIKTNTAIIAASQATSNDFQIQFSLAPFGNAFAHNQTVTLLSSSTTAWVQTQTGFDYKTWIDYFLYGFAALLLTLSAVVLIKRSSGHHELTQ